MHGVTGRAVNRLESYQEVMEIDDGKIKRVAARTFYEDHVVGWKATGRVPKALLQPAIAPGGGLKVPDHLSSSYRR